MPLLFLLIFGIIEFGWGFAQLLDVRHGAREGARLAAVNAAPVNGETAQGTKIARETCERMDIATNTQVFVTLTRSGAAVGDDVNVLVTKPLQQLTSFLAPFLNGVTLTSDVDMRLEQPATWADVTNFDCSLAVGTQ